MKDLIELQKLRNSFGIRPQQKWKHFKGTIYTIVDVFVDSDSGEFVVGYMKGEEYWSREVGNFLEEITREGKIIQRFTLYEDI